MLVSRLLTAAVVVCIAVLLCSSTAQAGLPYGFVPNAGAMSYADVRGSPYKVDYDHRALRINGERVLLMSAGMHYPRSSPSMWPQLMEDSRKAGLNTVQTYVFHNYHEEERGHWDWTTEHRNLSRFLQAAADAGLFVNLRIGPYVCAEWFYGGQPLWLHDSGFAFRDYNPGWTEYMENMMTAVVKYVEPFLARNGGPIILTQIENEYGQYNRYVEWCGNLTQKLNTDTVWIMCQQPTPPPPVLATCNGDDCSGWVQGQQALGLPAGWTEDWVAWFQHWGEGVPTRDSRNIAYDVASFFAKGGIYQNYYMWHGGTNFGRTVGGPNIITSYDYDGPLDEFGVPHEPKYSHLTHLHLALRKYANALLGYNFSLPQSLGHGVELYSYGSSGSDGSVAFLRNTGGTAATVKYQGSSFNLAAYSVQVVDAKAVTVQYDSSDISGLTPSKWPPLSTTLPDSVVWYPEPIGASDARFVLKSSRPLEQVNATRYRSQYLWYSTQVQYAGGSTLSIGLSDAGDHEHFFFNSLYLGRGDGADRLQNFSFTIPDSPAGSYSLSILSITQGLENGADSGLRRGLNGEVRLNGDDITSAGWLQQVGLRGEWERYYTGEGSSRVEWNSSQLVNAPMTWYRLSISTPAVLGDAGWATWALDLASLSKGSVWFNGFMLGAYWLLKDGSGAFSQQLYHVPRDYVLPEGHSNNVVLLEEEGGDPSQVKFIQRNQRGSSAQAPHEPAIATA